MREELSGLPFGASDSFSVVGRHLRMEVLSSPPERAGAVCWFAALSDPQLIFFSTHVPTLFGTFDMTSISLPLVTATKA